ncbi:unnamed protein product [Polarella glacialis]|uniref:Uncharacterized protein n=1 Tax=Polarella glacialis TaxID=89957 RepID=A0A813H5G2_POLGL|nr:unnamed protein product [Polarella glacialis]
MRLAEAQETIARLEAECQQHLLEGARHAELQQQQEEIARSFAELKGVVSLLVPRLSELDGQRARLAEEKGAAEAVAVALRAALQPRLPQGAAAETVEAVGVEVAKCSPLAASMRSAAEIYGRNQSFNFDSFYTGRHRATSPTRLRCRATTGGLYDAGFNDGSRAPLKGLCRREAARGWVAEAKLECELLKQKLRVASAPRSRSSGSRAEAKASSLQNDMRAILASWCVPTEGEACGRPKKPVVGGYWQRPKDDAGRRKSKELVTAGLRPSQYA